MKHMSQRVQASMTGLKSLLSTESSSPRLRLVDQVEETRKGIAEIEAAPAAVTDVEDPAQLRVDLVGDR